MPKRSSKPRDLNSMAAAIVAQSTTDGPTAESSIAVESGRRGGQRGGPARAAKLTPEERSRIARNAAAARWRRD
jgi:hypothetical protein